jgi:hypothetical protein
MQPRRSQKGFPMSFPWKLLGLVMLWTIPATSSTVFAQEKKDPKADDDKTELNKALKGAAGLGKWKRSRN